MGAGKQAKRQAEQAEQPEKQQTEQTEQAKQQVEQTHTHAHEHERTRGSVQAEQQTHEQTCARVQAEQMHVHEHEHTRARVQEPQTHMHERKCTQNHTQTPQTNLLPKSPTLSILVPVYNVSRYLEQCLNSIANQTFNDFEVICINDGSTDNSRAIIEQFTKADSRFKIINKENSGYGDSMNRGLNAARGRYIGIVESDDFIEPRTFSTLINTAEKHDAEVVKANAWLYWSLPVEKNEFLELVPRCTYGHPTSPQKDFAIFFLKPSIWSAVYRLDFLRTNNICFLGTPGASYQDASFNFKVWASATRVVFLKEAFLHYRQDNEASSVNSASKTFCVCDEYAEMERYLNEYSNSISDANATNDDATNAMRAQKKARNDRNFLDPVLMRMRSDTYMWNYNRLEPTLGLEFLRHWSEEYAAFNAAKTLNLSYLGAQRKAEIRAIINDFMGYHKYKLACKESRRVTKLGYFLKQAGIILVAQIMTERLAEAVSQIGRLNQRFTSKPTDLSADYKPCDSKCNCRPTDTK